MASLSPTVATLLPKGLSVPKRLRFRSSPCFSGVSFLSPASTHLQRLPRGSNERQYSGLQQIEKYRRHLRMAQRTESLRKMQPHVRVCFSLDLLFGVANGAPTAASLPGVAGQRLCPHSAPALEARVLERRRRAGRGRASRKTPVPPPGRGRQGGVPGRP